VAKDSRALRDPCSCRCDRPSRGGLSLSDIVAGAIVGVATGVVVAKIGRGSPDTV
jgi:hypothetical protein